MDKQLSKEEQRIRENAFKMSGSMGTDALDYVWPEIEEMTKQTAIGFTEWKDLKFEKVRDNCYIHIPESLPRFQDNKTYTTEQLYGIYLQTKNQLK